MKKILHLLSTGFILLCFVGTMVPGNVLADSDFQRWVKAFYPKAKAAGISRATYDLAFAGVTEPDSRILEKANYQAEFTTEIWDYLDTRINPRRVEAGLEKGELYWQILQLIEKKLGVEPQVLLAIWAMESNYGAIFERPERLFSVISALATLAYGDKKRKKFGESQLIAALQILQAGDIAVERMNGSWAGAMGHTQFIPTSYLAYGVDMDGDGRRDIWDSIPDALATAANLLRKNGWQTGRTWGYEVKGPAGAAKLADQSKTLEQWQQLGFVRVGSRPFPRPGDKAVLKVLGGENGPLFLMVKNFFVLKRYNNSDFYALSVGL
ncbi:MAG: lytic murein transglycosylase, partial [Thermodesulfobacteriota bacterium]